MTGSMDRQILEAIRAVAVEQLDFRGDLDLEMRLVEDLELDSLKRLTLAVEVEDRFRICLDPEAEAVIVTVADLVRAVRRKLDAGSTDAE
jgi:acyl carrier protein